MDRAQMHLRDGIMEGRGTAAVHNNKLSNTQADHNKSASGKKSGREGNSEPESARSQSCIKGGIWQKGMQIMWQGAALDSDGRYGMPKHKVVPRGYSVVQSTIFMSEMHGFTTVVLVLLATDPDACIDLHHRASLHPTLSLT